MVDRVRVIATTVALFLASPAWSANEECWSRGYRDGWCDGRGDKVCTADRLAVRPPPSQAGSDDCDVRYVDGYVAGQKAGMPPQRN